MLKKVLIDKLPLSSKKIQKAIWRNSTQWQLAK